MDLESPRPLIIYLHGFNSSPQSYKAQALGNYMQSLGLADCYQVPALPIDPVAAVDGLCERIESQRDERSISLIGSSLGGYYATYLSDRYKLRAVLINPATAPAISLAPHVGVIENYHTGEEYEFSQELVNSLLAYDVEPLRKPDLLRVYLQTGDETLDYRQAVEKYKACDVRVEEGGNHMFEGFERHYADVLAFTGFENKPV